VSDTPGPAATGPSEPEGDAPGQGAPAGDAPEWHDPVTGDAWPEWRPPDTNGPPPGDGQLAPGEPPYGGRPTQPAPASAWRDPRTAVWIAIGVVVLVVLVHDRHLSSYDLMFYGALAASAILHEVSHGAVALACGDDTARRAGRLTLNPVRHIDPFGTVVLPVLMVLSGHGALAYAKPVPVNVSRLRRPRDQSVAVALAGPATNVVLALACGIAVAALVPAADKAAAGFGSPGAVSLAALPGWARFVFVAGLANVVLAAFNLIPLPPLDGSAVLERLLPQRWLGGYYRIRPYTLFLPLAMVLIFPSALAHLFDSASSWWGSLLR